MKHFVVVLLLIPGLAAADKTYNGGKGSSWDCNKDPVVTINHGDGNYTFTGTCKVINVNGGENTLHVAAVDTVNLNGGENTLDLGEVQTINVDGADNKIRWKKSKTGDKPTIRVVGENNKVTKAN